VFGFNRHWLQPLPRHGVRLLRQFPFRCLACLKSLVHRIYQHLHVIRQTSGYLAFGYMRAACFSKEIQTRYINTRNGIGYDREAAERGPENRTGENQMSDNGKAIEY
jgi:hypothetical protein